MPPKPVNFGPFIRGVNASTDNYTQPKGSVPRASSMIMTDRGSLTGCDGSAIINFFGGAVQSGQGKFLANILFQPTGVTPYYLSLVQKLDANFGPPVFVSATPSSGGSLVSGQQYFYVITAIDGVGGETIASNEISATASGGNLSITLLWNVVPNAFGYNIYRGTASGAEVLMNLAGSLPFLQPSFGNTTATFIDSGIAIAFSQATTIANAIITGSITFGYPATAAPSLPLGQFITASGYSPAGFNGTFKVLLTTFSSGIATVIVAGNPGAIFSTAQGTISTSNSTSGSGPPLADTTQQTALVLMPSGQIPVSYSDADIVAFFPASIGVLGQPPSGGSGGSGTTGPGIVGQGASTPSGGIAGLVGPIPQMVQFLNRICIALGNGFPPQVFWDASGTAVNPATTGAVASVSATADYVTVTVTGITLQNSDPTAKGFMPSGSSVVLSNMSDASYNGAFSVILVSSSVFKVRNPNASGGASTGNFTVSTTPIINTFSPSFPPWTVSIQYNPGDIIVPAHQPPNPIYVTCIQGGISVGEPGWNSPQPKIGDEFFDGASIIWKVTALLNSAAPPPPGAGHIIVYSGSLWVINTSPTNTANGLDGPCAMRMSTVDNIFSWNPINQAFLDKDDGNEGMGFATFTISAEGIPPEGSLVAFKNYSGYQIIGVFGSSNFSIQRIRSDMGCTAPRTIWFVPGYGVARYSHLGVALFDGVRDSIVSEEMRPYLFPTNDVDVSDIMVADANFMPLAQGCLTANPPMYVVAIPIGNSGGKLTRILNYDLVLKCWGGPVDLPFAISTLNQVRPVTSNPLTIFGGFSDGVLQRWQAGDVEWYTGSSIFITPVAWSMTTPEAFGSPQDQKLHWRRLVIRAVSTGGSPIVTVTPIVNGVAKPAQKYTVAGSGDIELLSGIRREGLRFAAIISGSGHLEISRVDFQVYPKQIGVPSIVS